MHALLKQPCVGDLCHILRCSILNSEVCASEIIVHTPPWNLLTRLYASQSTCRRQTADKELNAFSCTMAVLGEDKIAKKPKQMNPNSRADV